MLRLPLERWPRAGVHLALYAMVLLAAARYLKWTALTPAGWATLAVCGALGVLGQAWISGQWTWPARWLVLMGFWLGAWLVLRLPAWPGLAGVTPWQEAYLMLATPVLGLAVQALWNSLPPGPGFLSSWCEAARLIALPALAVWLFQPFLSPDFFGGQDARSYGYGMIDVLQQVRAGVFPVFVGQGEFMFNGAVHPIRTAPYHQYFGIMLDLLTARALTPLAVQHLTVVLTAIQSGLTCYVCLTLLAPAHRWLAWVMSAIYVSTPALAHYVYQEEMYMTFMTFAYLPLVFFGCVRVIQRDDMASWACLAVGLAFTWLCHAPVAAWLTLCVAGLQVMRLLMLNAPRLAWQRAGVALLLFGGLTAYYFWSIAEISRMGRGGPQGMHLAPVPLMLGLALVAGWAGVVRFMATGRWRWLGAAAGAALVLVLSRQTGGPWLGATLVLAAALGGAGMRWPGWHWRTRLPVWTALVLLAGGLLSLPWLPPAAAIPAYGWVERLFPGILLPVSDNANMLSDLQVGYGLWGALLLGVSAAIISGSLELQLLSVVSLGWMALLLPVPGVTRLLLGAVPEPLQAISSDIPWIRHVPTMIGLATFVGFLGGVGWMKRLPHSRLVLALLAGGALLWNLGEAQKFIASGYLNMTTSQTTSALLLPENIRQFAYVFPGMPVSPYLTNGVVDYHLESRLLRGDDPTREMGEPVDWTGAQRLTFATRVDPTSTDWLNLEPKLTLAPGERRLLRFEFFDKPYAGTLILQGSDDFHREYLLPEAGFWEKSFGVTPGRPKTIAIWNSSAQPRTVEFLFTYPELTKDGRTFGDFARVEWQPYDVEKLPVRTLGLIPYRAAVHAETPVYLETPRTFIPGYAATVNGHPASVIISPNSMAMVKLAPGENTVELRYAGTWALRAMLLLSALVWLGVLLYAMRAWRRQLGTPRPATAN